DPTAPQRNGAAERGRSDDLQLALLAGAAAVVALAGLARNPVEVCLVSLSHGDGDHFGHLIRAPQGRRPARQGPLGAGCAVQEVAVVSAPDALVGWPSGARRRNAFRTSRRNRTVDIA